MALPASPFLAAQVRLFGRGHARWKVLMKVTRQSVGNYHMLPDDHEEMVERCLSSPQTTRCVCGKFFIGTARDGHAWAARHRAEFHPTWVDRGQKIRAAAAKQAPQQYWGSSYDR